MPGILPSLTIQEALDVTRIYSVADMLPADEPLIRQRPFRSPHHTVSYAGLVGGGRWPKPGEISLAFCALLLGRRGENPDPLTPPRPSSPTERLARCRPRQRV
jgi:hypothetical protein